MWRLAPHFSVLFSAGIRDSIYTQIPCRNTAWRTATVGNTFALFFIPPPPPPFPRSLSTRAFARQIRRAMLSRSAALGKNPALTTSSTCLSSQARCRDAEAVGLLSGKFTSVSHLPPASSSFLTIDTLHTCFNTNCTVLRLVALVFDTVFPLNITESESRCHRYTLCLRRI